MDTKTPELLTIDIAGRKANGYAVIGTHGHGRVVIRISASHEKSLDRFTAVAVRVLVEHEKLWQRLAPTVVVRSPITTVGEKFTKVRLEQFVRDVYADLIARFEAGEPRVMDLFAPVFAREESDAITLLGTYGWKGDAVPTTLPVQS